MGFTGNKFKYSAQELKDRGLNFCYKSTSGKWPLKKTTYTNEGVWGSFTKLRDSFRGLLTRSDGFVESDQAHFAAQVMMDAFLIRRSTGKDVEVPTEVVLITAAPDGSDTGLISGEVFQDGKNVSENEKLRWVFENMDLKDVRPENAPSAGTYSYLMRLRGDSDAKNDFYKTLWPKLLTKEGKDDTDKLNDSGKDTIALIERLQEAID